VDEGAGRITGDLEGVSLGAGDGLVDDTIGKRRGGV
jgi:hypothetical protein